MWNLAYKNHKVPPRLPSVCVGFSETCSDGACTRGWHYKLCLISESRPPPLCVKKKNIYIYMSQRNRCNALTFYNFTVYQGGVPSQRGQKWNYTSSASPPSAFGLFLPFPTDFNLFGAADWQPVLSPHVTVVEISLRGSMQISSDRARASGGGGKKNSVYWRCTKHTNKKIPVSSMEL